MYNFAHMKKLIIHAQVGSKIFKEVPIFVPCEKKKPLINLNQKCLVDTSHLMEILDCGKPTAVKIGTSAKAKITIGRKILWNTAIIQQYLNEIAE